MRTKQKIIQLTIILIIPRELYRNIGALTESRVYLKEQLFYLYLTFIRTVYLSRMQPIAKLSSETLNSHFT